MRPLVDTSLWSHNAALEVESGGCARCRCEVDYECHSDCHEENDFGGGHHDLKGCNCRLEAGRGVDHGQD